MFIVKNSKPPLHDSFSLQGKSALFAVYTLNALGSVYFWHLRALALGGMEMYYVLNTKTMERKMLRNIQYGELFVQWDRQGYRKQAVMIEKVGKWNMRNNIY